MLIGIDVKCMHTIFGGCSFSIFGDLIDWNQLKKFMLVGIDVKCMHTNFGGCSLSGFGDTATFKNGQISFSDHGLLLKVAILGTAQANSTLHRKASAFLIVHGHQKI